MFVTLVFARAALMALYHILAALFGWEKEKKSKPYFTVKKSSGLTNSKVTNSLHSSLKAKGDAFENYVVKCLSRDYTIKEWRSDKYIDGIYAESNTYPDLEIECGNNCGRFRFAVECKYRASLIADAIEIAKPHQLKNYAKFSTERNVPVFIAVGLGGYPSNPTEEFIILLESVVKNVMTYRDLVRFRRRSKGGMYFDCHAKVLS